MAYTFHKPLTTNCNIHPINNKKILCENPQGNRIHCFNLCNNLIFLRRNKRTNNPNLFRNNLRIHRLLNNANPIFKKQSKNKLLFSNPLLC